VSRSRNLTEDNAVNGAKQPTRQEERHYLWHDLNPGASKDEKTGSGSKYEILSIVQSKLL
jgi:hypothetical protein